MSDEEDDNTNTPGVDKILVHTVPNDRFTVGVSSDMDDMVVIRFVGDDGIPFAFAFNKEGAAKLHDGVCASLAQLITDDEELFENMGSETLH